jgi:signal transduction histidine kinase/ligand-binding sensor domain-containing protein
MYNQKTYSLLLLLSLIIAPNSYAIENIRFKTITIEQGLPSASTHSILVDSNNYLWAGAEGVGAFRYDGNTFTTYSNIISDTTSISNNFVERILEDKQGRLWFATQNGLNLFNQEQQTFKRFFHSNNDPSSISGNSITSIIDYQQGSIWVTTMTGVSMYDEPNDRFFHVALPNMETNFLSYSITTDKENNIWIGIVNYGIILIKRESILNFMKNCKDLDFSPKSNFLLADHHHNITDINKNLILDIGYIFSITYDESNNKIWIGTDNGLLYLNHDDSYVKRKTFTHPIPDMLNEASIRTMTLDDNNNLWMGTTNEGLIIYNTLTEKSTFLTTQNRSTSNITSNTIRQIYLDKNNQIWIATKFGGINLYDKKTRNFTHITRGLGNSTGLNDEFVMAVFQDNNKDVWFGTKLGALNKWDTKNNSFKIYRFNKIHNSQILQNRIHKIIQAPNNCLYLGNSNTLELYNPQKDSVSILMQKTIHGLGIDDEKRLWVGTTTGVHVFNTKTNTEITQTLKNHKQLTNPNLWVLKVLCDSKNRVWMGGQSSGLWRYDSDKDSLINFSFNQDDSTTISGNMIRGLKEDSKGNIWIGTKADGLNRYDEKTNSFVRYDSNPMLQGITVYNIEEDDFGCLWFGTHDGIIKYCPTTYKSEKYSIDFGLQGKIFEINAHQKLSDGRIIMGGQNGFNIFNPKDVVIPENNSSIVITNFKIYDQLIKKDLAPYDTIYLSRKDNYISFDFALLDYTSPKDNEYAYMLTNVDKDWIFSGGRNFVSYTNIPPGTYTFMVKAANPDKIWTETPFSITIIMSAPFWMKGWFRISFIAFLILISILVFYLKASAAKKIEKRLLRVVRERTYELHEANEELTQQKEQIIIQNEELEKHRINLENLVQIRTLDLEAAKLKAEQSDSLKSAFLANMSHEIRTPLNAILGFSDLLTSGVIPIDEMPEINKVIHSNGESLLQLINDIMDVSLIEANQIKIIKKDLPLKPFFMRACKELEVVFNKEKKDSLILKGIIAENINDTTTVFANEHRIKQIIQNLLANAIKFTPTGQITIGCELYSTNKDVLFFVKDTGIGIADEYKDYIFDRFRKIEYSTEQIHRGTGLGLSISKNLCELMGGKIWVESKVGEGSTFYFTIPL